MRNRFNAEKNPLNFNFDFAITSEAESAFYYIANLMYNDYTEDEVQSIFSDPKSLAEDISDMLNEFTSDSKKDEYENAVIAISCVLLTHFSK